MPSTISVSPAEILEGADQIVFRVSLSEASLSDITVQYRAVQDGSALVGRGGDVEGTTAEQTFTLIIPAGSTQAEIRYNIDAIDADEFDENFTLELSDPVNAILSGGEPVLTATGVILDSDGGQNLALFVSDPLVFETDAGGQQAVFEIRLSQPFAQSVTLDYTTADGTALAGEDYVATSGSVTFAPGQTVASVAVDILGDTLNEALETFSLVVSSIPTFIASEDSTSTATIQDRPPQDPIIGTPNDDNLVGTEFSELINGLAGADTISAGNGNDSIAGGGGADEVDAGAGNDTVDGGNGRDLAVLGDGNDVFNDNDQGGELGADTVLGGLGNDTINGGAGADEFRGGTGNDVLSGGAGNDSIFGGDQADTISGGDGNDTVDGGNGRDNVTLNQGNDVFNDND
ncbi:Calx-beta domain-containing protein, partial [uncultured Tateyamaria sp.]|uniref:calcium-binding protein n=1 Tax=uncultured Tateyamaria sp. TaxID=455651 RepID=UPI0026155E2D